jgi:hypothetical protein
MTPITFHPAMVQLLWLQSCGRRRRLWAGFCQPRRMVLTAIACVMTVVWLGNVALTVWLRERATPETLRALLSLGLVLYASWHFTKAAFFRPESPFDWSPAERDLLLAMPLQPRHLVAHQLASVAVTTLVKAGLLTLLLLPDLRCVPLGLAGLLLAMMTLEILRMAIDIATWGASRSFFLAYRAAVLAGLAAAGLAVGAVFVREFAPGNQRSVSEEFLPHILEVLVQLKTSGLGYIALPFQTFIDLILADALTATNVSLAAVAFGIVAGLAAGVIGLYVVTSQRVAIRERRHYRTSGIAASGSSHRKAGPTLSSEPLRPLARIARWGGAGPLAWRQLVGARAHWASLLTAMIAPGVLACSPCFFVTDPHMALLTTTGTLAFYTFLLLPTALRFDFRRDLDRLATLKGLPITPAAATIGQTLAPVLIATLFQSIVLAFAIVMRSLPPHHLFVAILVMIPLNMLVFGLDNLIYLLFPYRMQQEGLEIFVRTMLTFTGKGLLFTVGMVVIAGWGLSAAAMTAEISQWSGSAINALAVFIGGIIAGLSILAAIALYCLCLTYRNIDPVEDIPR